MPQNVSLYEKKIINITFGIQCVNFQDAGSQQIGFLLGSCNVSVALTSDACFKGLPKTATGEIVSFKGWPKLHWVITENLTKAPKDWIPPPRLSDETTAYVEVCPITHSFLETKRNSPKLKSSF